jgi:spore germination protein GerM
MSKKWLAVSIFTLLLFGGIWFLSTYHPTEDHSRVWITPIATDMSQSTPGASAMTETLHREVTLFIGEPATGTLVRKIREIETDQGLIHEIDQTIEYLIHPESDMRNAVIPDGTELLNVFVTRTGIVYLNLNRHIQDRHIGGLSAELATITSLVNTLLFNFKEINQVQILVEGTEIETLAGHVDCRKPFSKMLLIDS